MRYFGTDGIRGIANMDLTHNTAFELGRSIALSLPPSSRVVVGKDTRISGDMLEASLTAGLTSYGADCIHTGILPTPAVAYLIPFFDAQAGVVISASHNPAEYNGLKVFDERGVKYDETKEAELESLFLGCKDLDTKRIGRTIYEHDALKAYCANIVKAADCDLTGLYVALDCCFGAAYYAAPYIFRQLGAKVFCIGAKPSGELINSGCGALHPDKLRFLAASKNVDVGFCFDGDADRLIAVYNDKIYDGDYLIYANAIDLKNRNKLKSNTVVGTVMTNLGVELSLKKEGVDLVRTQVGDKYVHEKMLKDNLSLGGEQSGHIIFGDLVSTGDGILSAVLTASLLKRSGKTLQELTSSIERMPQIIDNYEVIDKASVMSDRRLTDAISEANDTLKGRGRVLVRASGTENKIRVMVEGKDSEEISRIASSLGKLIG